MKRNIILHAITSLLIILCIFLTAAAQTSFLPNYLNDSYLVADLLLGLVCAVGVLGGGTYGALAGILAGLCADAAGGFGICLLPIFYMLCGYACHVVHDLIPKKKFLVYLVAAACLTPGRALMALIYTMLHTGHIPLLDVFRYVCLPIVPGTLLFLPLCYAVALGLTLPLNYVKKNSIDKIM